MNLFINKRCGVVRLRRWRLSSRMWAACTIGWWALSTMWGQVSSDVQTGRTIQQAVSRSAALFATNNMAEAEQVILASNRSRPATALWNVESAHLLIRVASECSAKGRGALGLQVALRAIHHLDEAVQKATGDERGALASAHELAGFIYERFVGNVASAKARYLAATALEPKLSSAREALARMTIADSDVTMRSRSQ